MGVIFLRRLEPTGVADLAGKHARNRIVAAGLVSKHQLRIGMGDDLRRFLAGIARVDRDEDRAQPRTGKIERDGFERDICLPDHAVAALHPGCGQRRDQFSRFRLKPGVGQFFAIEPGGNSIGQPRRIAFEHIADQQLAHGAAKSLMIPTL